MKDFILKIKNLLKNAKGAGVLDIKKGGEHDPYKDWAIIFSIASFIFVAVFSYSIYLFYTLNSGLDKDVSVVTETSRVFDEKGLVEKIQKLNSKKEVFEIRKNESVQVRDPSI